MESFMNNESPISQYKNLQEGFVRINDRIERFRGLINGGHGVSEIPDFIIREIAELETDLQFVADKLGLDIDMEAKNNREIESVLTKFMANNYGASTEQATQIARHLMTVSQSIEELPTGTVESAALKAIMTVDVQYKRIDKSSWLRSINIWHLRSDKPARYNAEASIPRDELPPAVREQSLTTGNSEFHIRIFPQE